MKMFVTLDSERHITGCYPDDLFSEESRPHGCVEITTDVWQVWLEDQTKILGEDLTIKPAPAPVVTSDYLLAYAAAKRYALETSGITVDGVSVMTDRQSQSLITGAYNYLQANPDLTVKFKGSAGFVQLTAAQMVAIANAVGAHVQASFAAEEAVAAGICAGDITQIAEVDAAFASAPQL